MMTVLRDLMSRHFETVLPDCPMKEAMDRMEKLNLSMLLVCLDRRVLGALVESELRALRGGDCPDLGETEVREFMCLDVLSGQEDQDVRELVAPMRQRNLPLIPVLDHDRRMVGVFTLGGPWKRSVQVAERS
jgi:CBS domain-containing protein